MPARVVLSFDDAIITEIELSKPVTVVGRHPACDEVGKHKARFFEDALLAGGVGNLKTTVLPDYERTMMAAHVPESPRRPAPSRGDPDLSRTMAIPRDPTARLGPGQEAVSTRADASNRRFALKATAAGVFPVRGLRGAG